MKKKMLFSIAIVLLILQFGNSYDLNKNCLQGPKYWCSSIEKANECNAFKHCLQTVWSTHNRFLLKEENNKKPVVSNNLAAPNKCLNCIQCLTADYRRCPYIRLYQDEINQLLSSNIGRKPICQLLKQCDESDMESEKIDEQNKPQELNTIDDLNNDSRFKCGIHPRNWCNSIETARQCNAVDYCLINWAKSPNKLQLKESLMEKSKETDSSKVCGFCVFVFSKVQAVLQQNQTEQAILDYLEGSCNLLPQQDMVQNCLNQVDKYLPEIYNMVRNNVDPGIICRVLKACRDEHLESVSLLDSKQQENELTEKVIAGLKGLKIEIKASKTNENFNTQKALLRLQPRLSKSMGVGCELCEIVLTSAKYLIENRVNQDKVLGFIENQLCARLGNLNKTCVEYVREEGATILSLLVHNVNPAIICRAMGLCLKVQVNEDLYKDNYNYNSNDKFFDLNMRSPVNCTLCKLVVENVKHKLAEKKSQAEIIDYINKNLCEKAGNSKELCKSLIDSYAPLFFEAISKDINPAQFCEMIGMCEASQQLKPIVPITILENQNTQASPKCVMCEFVVSMLAKYIKSNASEAEIEQGLNYVCQKAMPATIRPECNQFVSQYGPIIAELLSKQMEPEKVCTMINLCPSRSSNAIRLGNKVYYDREHLYKNTRSQKGQSTSCAVCEFIVKLGLSESKIDQTERIIEFSISNICKITPRKYRAQCERMVEQHGSKIVELMNKYSDPTKICQMINYCQNDDSIGTADASFINLKFDQPIHRVRLDDENVKFKTGNTSIECSLCMYAAQLATSLLKQNKTEKQIITELDLICNLFPSNIKDQCVAFVDEYAPYVIHLIAQELDPQMTCISLNLCDRPTPKTPLRSFLDKL